MEILIRAIFSFIVVYFAGKWVVINAGKMEVRHWYVHFWYNAVIIAAALYVLYLFWQQ
ncbi:hypothetical protein LCGC14_2157450, partial [marine sediment metagenome]